MNDENVLRIGTRKSPLAMWQAEYVRDHLQEAHDGLRVELHPIETKGDKILDVALSKVGGKGLFVKELEVALLDRRVDICVHSTKDMPGELPEGLGLVAFPPRADPRDALVLGGHGGVASLRHGARVGTSSLRRQAQLLAQRPDLEIVSVRGNIQTRMKKVEELGLDCVVLACAGIERMAEADKIGHRFHPDEMLPAAAQGILSIEARLDDERVLSLISVLDDEAARRAALCERAFLQALGGGCQVPIAAHATEHDGTITLKGLVGMPDGTLTVSGSRRGPIDDPVGLGRALGEEVVATGGRRILVALGLGDGLAGGGAGELAGRAVVVARDDSPDDAISLGLLARGAEVVPLRLMHLDEPKDGSALEAAVRRLETYDAICFTSPAAVERTFEKMHQAGTDLRQLPADALVGAVGPGTRRALDVHHVHVDVLGEGGGEALAEALAAARDPKGRRILFPRAEGGRPELADTLRGLGAEVDVVDAYRSVPVAGAGTTVRDALAKATGEGRALVLTSPRRAEVLAQALGGGIDEALAGFHVVAIGKTTAAAAREAGLGEPAVASSPTPAGIAEAVKAG